MGDGGPIAYDTLIVATGARHAYFGHDEWAPFAPGLKTIEDAFEMRRRILIAFEAAEREADPEVRREWMTFVVVGGGPTGVELAGALGEIANDTLRRDFRTINPPDARILLIEALDVILPTYPEKLSRSAAKQLERLGVTVSTGTKVTGIDEHGVMVAHEDGARNASRHGPCSGPRACRPRHSGGWSPTPPASSRIVRAASRCQDLTIPGHPEIFVVGDLSVSKLPDGRPVPGVAPAAIQEGTYVAREIGRRLAGEPSRRSATPTRATWPRSGGCAAWRTSAGSGRSGSCRVSRVGNVARHPHPVPDRVRQPDRRDDPLGVVVLHAGSQHAADHRGVEPAAAADRGARPAGHDQMTA